MNTKTLTPIFLICLSALCVRLWWWNYTDYTAEDAHITFQFSRNIAEGNGFALNKGDPIYGTTTPLLTLLLATWLFFAPDPVLASKLIGLASVVGGLWFLYFSIEGRREAIIATVILAVSLKLIAEDMQGMEMPLLLCFMSAAWWGYVKDKPLFSGIMCGLLLWTRIDSVVFVGCLFIFQLLQGKSVLKFMAGTLVYLPWVIFATLYFGSPVPFTITAKAVAYGINSPSFSVHILRIVEYISWPVFIASIVGLFFLRGRQLFLGLFFIVNILFVAQTGATFFDRYFYMTTVTAVVIASLCIAKINIPVWRNVAILTMVIFSYNFGKPVSYYKEMQSNRHVLLTEMGVWLNQNAPENSTVFLEPLGYVGYYADRRMIDQVGLVTPQVVELYKVGLRGNQMYAILWPDFVIGSCGEYDNVMELFSPYYENIHKFDNGRPKGCYEIWVRK